MSALHFYVGIHQPSDAHHFDRACLSINRIRSRKSAFKVNRWIMDSGAFTEISTHGLYRTSAKSYAADARRWFGNGQLERIVAQDYMCEPFILKKTGLTVADHQRLTVERYDELVGENLPVPVMPVLQGYDPEAYRRHIDQYGDRLTPGMWVGVGSVCKRNASPLSIVAVLATIHRARPDLRLHGFGLKKTALMDGGVRALLHSADSMAWSFSARINGRSGNDWREAETFVRDVQAMSARSTTGWQWPLPLEQAAA